MIYGGGEKWEDRPDIREGATVREDQVLLLIPDLSNMQVKVGIHEAASNRSNRDCEPELNFRRQNCDGEVLSIASMAEPAGWWNGNMVKYETIIKLDTLQAQAWDKHRRRGLSGTIQRRARRFPWRP